MKTHFSALALVAALASPALTSPAFAEPAAYDSPEQAVASIVAAVEARDPVALLAVFGPEYKDLVFSGNEAEDRATWRQFYQDYRRFHEIERPEEGRAVLVIGRERWPFPADIVLKDGKWRFDAEGAREEVINRRIGLNELDVIEVLRRAPVAQARFREQDFDRDGVAEFAPGILSDPGQFNGLYWPDAPGEPESIVGELIARANADGYNFDGTDHEPEPYLGYYFRILTRQGANAPGGAYDYVINGNMVAGHAAVAFPAAYGETGVMTFLVNEAGTVWEADLGPDTLAVAGAIESLDPGEGWVTVGE
jgi:hypothetical protein